jgi:organic radical activating enzyme
MTFEDIWQQFFVDQNFAHYLKTGAILKLTGGEPLIQEKQLLKFVEFLCQKLGMIPRIDFETNATLIPDQMWIDRYGATFTTSPKLIHNGDPEEKTYKPEALKWHAEYGSGFKFVINTDKDIEEIWKKYVNDDKGINIPLSRIWFMPCCGSRQEHIEKAPAVAEYAKAMNVNFSPRLHLLVWDKALRV